MTGLNIVLLMGNLTKDPETRTAGNSNVTFFSIAVNRSYKDKNGELVKVTDFFNIDVWGKQGDVCAQYLSKGKAVFIEGRLSQDKWEDSDGNKKSAIRITAFNVKFLSPSSGNKLNGNNENAEVLPPPFCDKPGEKECPF